MTSPRAKAAAKKKPKPRWRPAARERAATTSARSRRGSTPARVVKRAAERATEGLQPSGPGGERIRPSHWRYGRAKLHLVERGTGPTIVAIAKELGINRVTLHRFLARYPWLDAWVDGLARAAAVHQHGQILLRHGHLAIQGSVQSADLIFKVEGGFYTRNAGGDDGGGAAGPLSGIVVNYNMLTPRPDYAGAAAAANMPALPVAAAPSKLPVVNVR